MSEISAESTASHPLTRQIKVENIIKKSGKSITNKHGNLIILKWQEKYDPVNQKLL